VTRPTYIRTCLLRILFQGPDQLKKQQQETKKKQTSILRCYKCFRNLPTRGKKLGGSTAVSGT